MICDNCKKESRWLEIIGSSFICYKCIRKSKLMGFILKTHMDTFRTIIRKLEIDSYEKLMDVKRENLEKVVDLKKYGIFLKTTNIVDIE